MTFCGKFKLVFEVPILIKSYPVDGFEIFNLQQYEMTPVEPMCDIGGHTTNLFNELLEQLNKNNKQLLLSIDSRNIQITKKILRNVGKRNMLLYVFANFYGKVTNSVILLLKSLGDIRKLFT